MPNQASVAGGPTMLAIMLLYAFFYLPIPTLLLSFLQVYLCRRNLRRGLILPIVSAVFGVLAALAVGLLIGLNSLPTIGPSIVLLVLVALVMFNIPTLVYFLIYRYQKRRRDLEDLDRMKIDDLE